MRGYIIVDLVVTDPEVYDEYRGQVQATLDEFGGRFLVRGGQTETLEGDWQPERMVVIEFDSVENAKAWWSSSMYADPKAMRQRSAKTNMLLVQGV